jgi:hypothetical protein
MIRTTDHRTRFVSRRDEKQIGNRQSAIGNRQSKIANHCFIGSARLVKQLKTIVLHGTMLHRGELVHLRLQSSS